MHHLLFRTGEGGRKWCGIVCSNPDPVTKLIMRCRSNCVRFLLFIRLGDGFELESVNLCILLFAIALIYCKSLYSAFYHNVFLSRSSRAEVYFQAPHRLTTAVPLEILWI